MFTVGKPKTKPRKVEQAYAMDLGICKDPKCRAMHIQLTDKDGQVFATAVNSIDNLPDMMTAIQHISDTLEERKPLDG